METKHSANQKQLLHYYFQFRTTTTKPLGCGGFILFTENIFQDARIFSQNLTMVFLIPSDMHLCMFEKVHKVH